VVRNTPLLVQLFIIFFGLPSLGVRLDAVTAALIALSVNLGASTTEIIRAGLEAVPRSQIEAGYSLGLSGRQVFTDGIYTFISEFTVKHRVPLAGGTYWNIAQTEIAQILEKQKALLHACEAETSMMLALSRADRSRWAPSVRSRGSNRLDKVARPMVRRGLFLIHALFRNIVVRTAHSISPVGVSCFDGVDELREGIAMARVHRSARSTLLR